MRLKLVLTAMILAFLTANGLCQCKSGDCENGRGIYDFGWCRYEGPFKNGKPEGKGIMTYEDGVYEGMFKDGVEDGEGIYTYKNGKKERVIYQKGTKVSFEPLAVATGGLKPLEGSDPNCLSGNCVTGRGTYRYPSGNQYTGDFVDRKRHGKGTVHFSNKDVAEGAFVNNEMVSGTYRFADGNTFQGKWNEQGEMYDGIFTSLTGATVVLSRGKLIEPARSEVMKGAASGGELKCDNKVTCPHCHGKGVENQPIVKTHEFTISSGYTRNSMGERTGTWYEGGTTRSTTQIPNYVPCTRCGGRGEICK